MSNDSKNKVKKRLLKIFKEKADIQFFFKKLKRRVSFVFLSAFIFWFVSWFIMFNFVGFYFDRDRIFQTADGQQLYLSQQIDDYMLGGLSDELGIEEFGSQTYLSDDVIKSFISKYYSNCHTENIFDRVQTTASCHYMSSAKLAESHMFSDEGAAKAKNVYSNVGLASYLNKYKLHYLQTHKEEQVWNFLLSFEKRFFHIFEPQVSKDHTFYCLSQGALRRIPVNYVFSSMGNIDEYFYQRSFGNIYGLEVVLDQTNCIANKSKRDAFLKKLYEINQKNQKDAQPKPGAVGADEVEPVKLNTQKKSNSLKPKKPVINKENNTNEEK